MNAHDYNITTRRVIVDGQTLFEARIQEFPDVTEFAESPAEAYELAIDTIDTLAEIYAEHARKLPAPKAPMDEYSGRVTLRLPKNLHRAVTIEAERQDVSLNQYLVSALGFHCGTGFGRTTDAQIEWQSAPDDSSTRCKPTKPNLRIVHSNKLKTADGWK